jgi:hypothetical protein
VDAVVRAGEAKWVKSGSGFIAKTPDALMLALSRIGTLDRTRRFVWRGAADHRWALVPSVVRDLRNSVSTVPAEVEVRRHELASIRQARLWGLSRELGDLATDLHVLALLQHHGVHTRLLDVTPNPMTALWFACQPAPGLNDASGVLFAVEVTDLVNYPTINDRPTWGSSADPHGWTLRTALAKSADNKIPFLVQPSLPDARMSAQEGLFIASAVPLQAGMPFVDGLSLRSRSPVGEEELRQLFTTDRGRGRPRSVPFCAIIIDRQAKAKMRDHLSGTFNRTENTLFPDVAGFVGAWNSGRLDATPPVDVKSAYDDTDAR